MRCARHGGAEPQQALGVAGQDLLAFGGGAGQAVDEAPGQAGRGERVVGTGKAKPSMIAGLIASCLPGRVG